MIANSILHYRILEPLGTGGMGVAYKAFDTRLKRTVALKTLHDHGETAPALRRELLREARAAAGLDHPNICTIYAVEETPEIAFIAMEYVHGETLGRALEAGPMAPDRVILVARQVADALRVAHEHGIVHRDIKSGNIMITPDGQAKVLDFGLARRLPGSSRTLFSASTEDVDEYGERLTGTPAYMSPEQLRHADVDGRSDLFSLGVVLYEIGSGTLPFLGPTVLATMARVLTEDPPPLVASRPGFPAALDRIIGRCLAKDREDRYSDASGLLDDLTRLSTRPSADVKENGERKRAVAVLPFADLGGGPTDEYFSEGITSELISKLAQSRDLLVISRTTTMRYRGASIDVRQIGRELGVDILVEGAVRRLGDRCRLNVELIDAADGFHIWADTFEVPLEGIFEVQNVISDRISRALSLDEAPPDRATVPTADVRAFEAYLRALHAYHKFTAADNLIAIELLERALALDPGYADAHALLASAYIARVERGWEEDGRRWLELAAERCAEALRCDSRVSRAYSARAAIHFARKEIGDAEIDIREALSIDDNNDIAHDLLGRIRSFRGEFEGAITAYRRALAINPYYVWCLNDLAWALWLTGREEEADGTLDRVLAISPGDEGGHTGRAWMSLFAGKNRDAAEAIGRARQSNPKYPFMLLLLGPILVREGRDRQAVDLYQEVLERDPDNFVAHASLGLVYAELGRRPDVARSAGKALEIDPFYPTLDLTYAALYAEFGEEELGSRWIEKALDEGVRIVEADAWNPRLRSLFRGVDHTPGERMLV